MTILTKTFWSAITAVFTDPYIAGVDAVRLHSGSIVSAQLQRWKSTTTVLKTPNDWNTWAISKCCDLLENLCVSGMVSGSTLNDVGKTLLKRGLVQLLFQQDALHPDNTSISWALVRVLSLMCRAQDGRLLLLHASELGCRFSGIDLLRHFLLHSDWNIVNNGFVICSLLLGASVYIYIIITTIIIII